MNLIELREVEHFGFAIYGYDTVKCSTMNLYHWAVDWFGRLGCVPHKAGADIGGKCDGRWKLFRNLDRRLNSAGFASVTHWELTSIPEELSSEKCGEYYGESMGISYGTGYYDKCLTFHVRESLIRNSPNVLLQAAREVCDSLQPQYGIGYRRKFKYMPSTFALGNRGGSSDISEDNSEYWMLLNRHEIYTLLRGVYPWNLFTSTQLNLMVGTIRLEDWIKSNPARGQLSRFTDQITLWTVSDEAIPTIRQDLLQARVILDRKRDFESKMYEYHVDEDVVAESLKTGIPLVHRPPGPGLSAEEMLGTILRTFGGPDSRVLKKEQSGQLRELTNDEVNRAKSKAKKSTKKSDSPPKEG